MLNKRQISSLKDYGEAISLDIISGIIPKNYLQIRRLQKYVN